GGVVPVVVGRLVGRADGRGVHELAAVGGVGQPGDVNRAGVTGAEVSEVAGEHPGGDGAVRAVLVPVDPPRQRVVQGDAVRGPHTVVRHDDRERRRVAGADSAL